MAADIARVRHPPATKSHIDALGDQVGLAIAEHEFQAHARMRGEKFAHPFDAKKIQATRLCPAEVSPSTASAQRSKKACPASVRVSLRVLHQARVQLRFQLLHAPAHAVGCSAQPARGFGKAAATHDLHVQRDVIEIDHQRPWRV
ncbi:hypothetical protein XGA_1491 [Xanthomonas hortorum ATCC 19865]|nr:hypothetical protein XGA_1491 [Xanthomonas hortorum ATCC 19865]